MIRRHVRYGEASPGPAPRRCHVRLDVRASTRPLRDRTPMSGTSNARRSSNGRRRGRAHPSGRIRARGRSGARRCSTRAGPRGPSSPEPQDGSRAVSMSWTKPIARTSPSAMSRSTHGPASVSLAGRSHRPPPSVGSRTAESSSQRWRRGTRWIPRSGGGGMPRYAPPALAGCGRHGSVGRSAPPARTPCVRPSSRRWSSHRP